MNRRRIPAHAPRVTLLFSWACLFSVHAFTATLELTPLLEEDASTHPIIVVYTSAAPIDLTTLDGDDIVVGRGTLFNPEIVGVDGAHVRLVSQVVEDDGKHARVTYEVARPTEGWTMNGTARDLGVAVQADAVKDVDGKGVDASFQWLRINVENDEDPTETPVPPMMIVVHLDADKIHFPEQESVILDVTYQSNGAPFDADTVGDDDLEVGWLRTIFRPDTPGTVPAKLLYKTVEAEGTSIQAIYEVERPEVGWEAWERTSVKVVLKEGGLALDDGRLVAGALLPHILFDFELQWLPQVVGLDRWFDALEESLDVDGVFTADGDADRDGLSDMTEFILDSHPLDPTDAVAITPGLVRINDQVFAQYSFKRRKNGLGVVAEVQASRDGRTWESPESDFDLQFNEEISETTEELTFRSRQPITAFNLFLIRIKVVEMGD